MRRLLLPVIVLLALGGGLLWLLSRPRPTDQELLSRLVTEAARAVEMRNPSGLLQHVSADYRDAYGNDKRELTRHVIGASRTPERLTIVPEMSDLQVEGPIARAVVHVRLWFSEPGAEAGHDLTIPVQFRREGRRWRIIWANGWEQGEEAYMNQPLP